jgi:Ca2+/Na+ antiporter
MLNWWPLFDFIAQYSHLATNFIFMYIAIYVKVTFFMFINVICISYFYLRMSTKINRRAMEVFHESGLQGQTDLKMAGLITKKYNIAVSVEFNALRNKLWKIQFLILSLAICIGFSSTLIYRFRDFLDYELNTIDPSDNVKMNGIKKHIEATDWWTFWFFIGGIYKDHDKEIQNYFYFPFFIMFACMVIERKSINWLYNRNGCNYNKF